MTDTLTKAADAVSEANGHYGSFKDESKAAARVILDSPEVMGLVEALEYNAKCRGKDHITDSALMAFQKLREMVGE